MPAIASMVILPKEQLAASEATIALKHLIKATCCALGTHAPVAPAAAAVLLVSFAVCPKYVLTHNLPRSELETIACIRNQLLDQPQSLGVL